MGTGGVFATLKHLCAITWNAKIKVEPLVFLYLLVWSFYFPLYEQYYFVRFGTAALENTNFPLLNSSQPFCLNNSQIVKYGGESATHLVQSLSNTLLSYGQFANRLPSIFIVIIIGPLSDRFGRKPILLAAGIGLVLQTILAVIITMLDLSPYWFIPANFLTGVCGDITGLLAGAFSYVSDVSTKKWRAFRIGVTCAMFEVGAGIGSLLCGLWLSQSNCNFIPPMWFVLGCSVGIVLWIIFLIKESLTKEDKKKARQTHPRFYTAFLNGLKLFFNRKPLVWKRWTAVITLDLIFVNAIGNNIVIVYFLKAPPFDVDPVTIGIYQALIAVSSGVCASAVMFVMSVVLKLPDSVHTLVGLLFQFSANVLMGLATTNTQIYLIALVQGVQVMSVSSLRTILSKQVSSEEEGALFSVVVSSESVAALLASIAWPLLLPVMIDVDIFCNSGTIFLLMAGINVLTSPFVIALLVSDVRKAVTGGSKKCYAPLREIQ